MQNLFMLDKKRGASSFIRNKRGMEHEIFFNIFELALAAIVVISLFLFISDVVEQTIFEKNYIARDLSVLANTIYAAPGGVFYIYDEDVSKFIVDFAPGKVTVLREADQSSVNNVFYLFD